MAGRSHADQSHSQAQTHGEARARITARANAAKSAIKAKIDPSTGSGVFAHQKDRFGLIIRTIDIKWAEAKLTLANLAYNFDRLIFHERRAATA